MHGPGVDGLGAIAHFLQAYVLAHQQQTHNEVRDVAPSTFELGKDEAALALDALDQVLERPSL